MFPWTIRKKYPNTWKQEYRFAIILGITLIVFYSCLQFYLHDDSHGVYSICTVESAYTKKRGGMLGNMNDVALIGVFETLSTRNDDRDFDTVRLEEIKE